MQILVFLGRLQPKVSTEQQRWTAERTKEAIQDLRRLLSLAREAEALHEFAPLRRQPIPTRLHERGRLQPGLLRALAELVEHRHDGVFVRKFRGWFKRKGR